MPQRITPAVRRPLTVIRQAGYSPHRMCARHAQLGATLQERVGTVAEWLHKIGPWRRAEIERKLELAEMRKQRRAKD